MMKKLIWMLLMLPVAMAAGAQTQSKDLGTIISGSFESKKGVMSPLSCHGFNVGYVTTTRTGERIAVCFDELEGGADLVIDCEDGIWASGYYREHSVNGEGNCSESKMKIFYIDQWDCK